MARNRTSDQGYALAKIECPAGHVLAKAVMSPPDYSTALYSGGEWTHERPWEHPLSLSCARCEARGVKRDLRGSWDKLELLLKSVVDLPETGSVNYRIGG